MYEVFPVIAGVIIALLVPRYVPSNQRKIAYGSLGAVVGVLATIIAREEWFFIFIDMAAVFVAIFVTQKVVEYWPKRNTTRLP